MCAVREIFGHRGRQLLFSGKGGEANPPSSSNVRAGVSAPPLPPPPFSVQQCGHPSSSSHRLSEKEGKSGGGDFAKANSESPDILYTLFGRHELKFISTVAEIRAREELKMWQISVLFSLLSHYAAAHEGFFFGMAAATSLEGEECVATAGRRRRKKGNFFSPPSASSTFSSSFCRVEFAAIQIDLDTVCSEWPSREE